MVDGYGKRLGWRMRWNGISTFVDVSGSVWLNMAKHLQRSWGSCWYEKCVCLSNPMYPIQSPIMDTQNSSSHKAANPFFLSSFFFFFSFSFSKLSVKCHCLPITLLRPPLGGWWQGCPPLHFSAFSLPHEPVQAGTLAVSCGLVPLRVGLAGACSGSFFSSCPLVTSQHHRGKKNKIDH